MKIKVLFASAAVLFGLVGAASVASADPPVQGQGGHGHDPAALVQRFDANKDGKLQVTELPERMRARLADADVNKDGVLTVAEIAGFRAQRMRAHFDRLDANKDGSVDAREAGPRWTHLQVADANKDGKVTFQELEAAKTAGLMHHARGQGGRGHGGRGHRR